MRASTLFALTAAALLGLGVAITAKYSGYFSRPVAVAPPPPPVVVALVAAKNLFAGDLIDGTGIRVRPLRADELDYYNSHKSAFLPPVPQAAVLRVAAKNIEADQIITRESLKDLAKPEPLHARLLPEMRAINVTLSKERSNGGLVQVGEWAELSLTSTLDTADGTTTRTVKLAPKVKVVAKRDTLWPQFAPLPKDKPVEYTLEVNSYRAALIEYSRGKGVFSLASLPGADQKTLEMERQRVVAQLADAKPIKFQDVGHIGDAEEQSRVDGVDTGELVVSEGDLIKVFDVQTQSPAPPINNVQVEQINGVRRAGAAYFVERGTSYIPFNPWARGGAGATNDVHAAARAVAGGSLVVPNRNGSNGSRFNFRAPADCKNCGGKAIN